MNRLDLTLRSTIHIQYANALDSSQLVVVVNALATNRLTDEELRRGGNEGGRLGATNTGLLNNESISKSNSN